jgi:hypothetical protein
LSRASPRAGWNGTIHLARETALRARRVCLFERQTARLLDGRRRSDAIAIGHEFRAFGRAAAAPGVEVETAEQRRGFRLVDGRPGQRRAGRKQEPRQTHDEGH